VLAGLVEAQAAQNPEVRGVVRAVKVALWLLVQTVIVSVQGVVKK
jgi:hypothetical protein